MNKPDVELSRLTTKGQCTLPRRIREYLGVGPGDHVAFILTDQGVLVKKLVVQEELPARALPADTLRELVLAIGHDAQARGLTEEEVERDIDRYLAGQPMRQGM